MSTSRSRVGTLVAEGGRPTARAVRLHFDDRDSFLGAEFVAGEALAELSAAFTRTFDRALTPDRFAEAHRLR